MSLRSAARRRLDPAERYGLRVTLLVVTFLLVAVPFTALLLQVESEGWLVRVDRAAAQDLHDWARRSPAAVTVLKAVTVLGAPTTVYLLTVPAVAWLWRRQVPRLAAFLVVTVLGGGTVSTVVKAVVDRPRPALADPIATSRNFSFPSGHALAATVAYGALLLVFLPAVPRRARVPLVCAGAALVAAVGFSRLALGVHYLTDVLAGWVLGLAWLAASTAVFSTWRVERGRPPVRPLEGLEPESSADLR